MASEFFAPPHNKKRLIVCCDGTWMNSDTGYEKLSMFSSVETPQPPSNVTRIARSLRRQCTDGTVQIIEYQSGVGSAGSWLDSFTGGAFGKGVSENIRVAYSFLAANYVDGDEIVLIGFSRGAFTARSVAGMIGDLGLLTREGMEFFYPIFKDMENWRTPAYKDPFPGIPFKVKPQGENAVETYRNKLLELGLTRVYQKQGKSKGDLIKIKAVAVWDTVGSLGIPYLSWFSKLGIRHSTEEFRFFDTNLSDRIEHAFQALALDEHRPPFSPAVWERKAANKSTTDLRQTWFPGNHGNVGGGWPDAGIANLSLTWMMDQLASVGVQFDEETVARISSRAALFYRFLAEDGVSKAGDTGSNRSTVRDVPEEILARLTVAAQGLPKPKPASGGLVDRIRTATKRWAVEAIYDKNAPLRPWGLGAIQKAESFYYLLAGQNVRSPNMYCRVNPATGKTTQGDFLQDTNERMHCSVRIRLALGGLGLNDTAAWDAPALKGRWRLKQTTEQFEDPIPDRVATWEPRTAADIAAVTNPSEEMGDVYKASDGSNGYRDDGAHRPPANAISRAKRSWVVLATEQQRPLESLKGIKTRWVWEYCGPESEAPPERLIVESRPGPFERQLLRLAGGTPNVYDFAEDKEIDF